jgi:hypothetical protein
MKISLLLKVCSFARKIFRKLKFGEHNSMNEKEN